MFRNFRASFAAKLFDIRKLNRNLAERQLTDFYGFVIVIRVLLELQI